MVDQQRLVQNLKDVFVLEFPMCPEGPDALSQQKADQMGQALEKSAYKAPEAAVQNDTVC